MVQRKKTIEVLFIVAMVGFSVALFVFNIGRIPKGLLSRGGLEDAAAPKTDRPSSVGNAVGEAFLRKVDRPPSVPVSGLISVEDGTFSAAYDELYDRRDVYYGREIELSGYVMGQEGLLPGGFLVGRDLLWCCEADKYFIGFLAFAEGSVPDEGSCVRVHGILEAASYTNPENGETFSAPAIRVARLEKAEGVSPVYPN